MTYATSWTDVGSRDVAVLTLRLAYRYAGPRPVLRFALYTPLWGRTAGGSPP